MSNSSSSGAGIDLAELTQQLTYNQAFAYGELAGLVLLAYDTLLTLSNEIGFIWRKKFHVVSILYLFARYGALGGLITFAVGILTPTSSNEFCTTIAYTSTGFSLIAGIGVHGLLLGRAYAVSGGNKWVLASLGSLLLVYIGLSGAHFRPCDAPQGPLFTLDAVLAAVICLSDAIALGVTLYHTWREYRTLTKIAVNNSKSLTGLLLNQGILRFIIIFTYAVENSISAKTLNPSIRGVEVFIENAISSILLCRFVLELRAFKAELEHTQMEEKPVTKRAALIRNFNDTLMDDFTDPYSSRTSSYLEDAECTNNGHLQIITLPSITAEEYPWAVRSDIEAQHGQ